MLLILVRKLLATKYGHYAIDVFVAAFILFAGYAGYRILHSTPDVQIVQTTPTVKTVYVDVPVLDTKTVTKFLTDPKDRAEVQRLLDENKKLKSQVTQLTSTIAVLQSHGDGPVIVTPATPTTPALTKFKDWRLYFETDGTVAHYDLTQKFQVLTTTGRDVNGKGIALVNLFEIGPNGEKTLLKAETTAIFADQTKPHWHISPAIQAGLSTTKDTKSQTVTGGIVGLQWLKKGRTSSAEDTTLAALTPVLFVAKDVTEVGVLPISFNLGAIKHQPLKDLWLSPYVGFDWSTRNLTRLGIGLTATF
jgi:hypothetical protein